MTNYSDIRRRYDHKKKGMGWHCKEWWSLLLRLMFNWRTREWLLSNCWKMARKSKSTFLNLSVISIPVLVLQACQAVAKEEALPGVIAGQDRPTAWQPPTDGGDDWVYSDWNASCRGVENWKWVSWRYAPGLSMCLFVCVCVSVCLSLSTHVLSSS